MAIDSKIYKNPNIFQTESANYTDFPASNISFRCPHCHEIGSFHALKPKTQFWKKLLRRNTRTTADTFYFSTRVCPNAKCLGLVFCIEKNDDTYEIYPPEKVGIDPKNLPTALLATLEEAVSCHAAGANRASAMMVRRLLEEICADCGAEGKTLHHRLDALKSKIILPVELFDAMLELKALGNDAAHIMAKNYDEIGHEEAEISIELVKEILKARYQLTSLVDRLKARKK
ncbi:MAG: DUF4145 domain-containing protein [Amylibacter sp.]|nr:DUF4145 domain-containing protein [Amylibacter sp.]